MSQASSLETQSLTDREQREALLSTALEQLAQLDQVIRRQGEFLREPQRRQLVRTLRELKVQFERFTNSLVASDVKNSPDIPAGREKETAKAAAKRVAERKAARRPVPQKKTT